MAAPRPFAYLPGPFCGWIKEAHVGRLQCGGLAHSTGKALFFVFLLLSIVDVERDRQTHRETDTERNRETQR